jgi:hypothetical protein
MSLSHEQGGQKKSAKIKIFVLNRAELLIHLCYEIPCTPEYVSHFTNTNFKLALTFISDDKHGSFAN